MYYELNERGYIDTFLIGGILENGIEFNGEEPTNEILSHINAYKIIDNKFVYDEEEDNRVMHISDLYDEQFELLTWLEDYDKKINEYNRMIRLKMPIEIDVDKLDQEAIKKINRLNQIKKELDEK